MHRVHSRVIIDGLQRRADLNGCEAEVLLSSSERFGVPAHLVLCPCLWDRLQGNEDLLRIVVGHLDTASLCCAKVADRRLRDITTAALATRPIRELYEHDCVRCAGEGQHARASVLALMRRAHSAEFAQDTEAEWFAGSTAPRTVRPPGMRFRVGDIYFHAQTGTCGVVLGWDDRRRAPFQGWGRLLPERLYAVHYSVLEVEDSGQTPESVEFLLQYSEESMLGRAAWAEGHQRYIVQDHMLSLGQASGV